MLSQDYNYEIQQTVEFDNFFHWTGEGNLTLSGQVYNSGKIIDVGSISVSSELGNTNTTVVMEAITDVDKQFYLGQDAGPRPAKVQIIWRKQLISTQVWSDWTIGVIYEGKLSDGTYDNGKFQFRIQRVYDDVWRGKPLRWTGSQQRRRHPDDNGLDLADRIRRTGIRLAED